MLGEGGGEMKVWEETWFAVEGGTHYGEKIEGVFDCEEDERPWTISDDPKHEGWCTDGGYGGYGLPYERARLAACAPELVRMLLELEWAGRDDVLGEICPECWGTKLKGHDDCALDALLRKAGVR